MSALPPLSASLRQTARQTAPTPDRWAPGPDDIEPVANETRDRIITGLVTVVPILALGVAAWQLWDRALHWHDLFVLALLYFPTALGVTVGFHRHFTHRSFATTKAVRAVLAALGSAAIEGPVISWVADHRKHHAFSDREGDPHSPHVGQSGRWAAPKGLLHAHVGWLFLHTDRAAKRRFAPDLLNDPLIRFIDRTFVLWAALGIAAPFGLGIAIGGTVTTGLSGLLWGGAVRIFLLHHVTYSINSLCHFFGRRRFATGDESRNLAWLAIPSLGEAWHNNHHAFPTSAGHGLRLWEKMLDPSAVVIRLLEKSGLAWDVVRVSPERMQSKTTTFA
jgi:stearoyl-CoA desaturase (Delta-9 desaturase)